MGAGWASLVGFGRGMTGLKAGISTTRTNQDMNTHHLTSLTTQRDPTLQLSLSLLPLPCPRHSPAYQIYEGSAGKRDGSMV